LTPAPRRLGVFGGAFDPPHVAHVALARAALDQLQLDELLVFPTGQAWHKARDLTAPAHRLALAEIAFGSLPRTRVDNRELLRQGPTYTVDTLRELRAEYPQAQLFLLMGEDQAIALTRWREWEAILAMSTLAIAARGAAAGGGHDATPGPVLPERARWQLLRLPAMPDSATAVRAEVAQGRDIGHLVPPGVASYIDRHHLYQPA